VSLDATKVSLWGGAAYIGQFAFQAVAPFTGDMFGRRVTLWLLMISMTIVSRNERVHLRAGHSIRHVLPVAGGLQLL
jgi:hypothetical protein